MLVTSHLDPKARLALLGTCTDTWGLVLETAPHATINVHVSDPVNMTTLRAVEGAMQARGELPTKLQLIATRMALLVWAVDWLAAEGCNTWLDKLLVKVLPKGLGADERLPVPALKAIARCCPNLRALTILVPVRHLPADPVLFWNLEELQLHTDAKDEASITTTCAPYIKQLTSLTINGRFELKPTSLTSLLSPTNPGTYLRTLRLPADLDDMLLGLLLGCAPALRDLHVELIDLQSDTHAATPAQWQQLTCGQEGMRLRLSELARLPRAPAMELACNHVHVLCDMTSAEVAALADRFKALQFSGMSSVLPDQAVEGEEDDQADEDQAVEEQPAALRAALTVLRTWCVGDPTTPRITLGGGWVMSPELMQELRDLPRWKAVSFRDVKWVPAQPYLSLLSWLPDSFTEVRIDAASGIRPGRFELHLFAGIAAPAGG